MSERYKDWGFMPPAELFDLADGVRAVMERMIVVDEPHEDLGRMRGELDDIATRLAAIGHQGIEPRLSPDNDPGPGDRRPYYAGNPTRWHYNPINPPLSLRLGDDGVVHGTVRLGLIYEGPPGCVHGGIVAFLLDQLLGHANLEHGLPAMTASLRVDYRRPTPLMRDLMLEAHPPTLEGERRCVTRGSIQCGEDVTAEAEGIFILPDLTRFALPQVRRDDDA
jgi:acyl-coenzyme A thioesterase PaaI-like protein